MCSTNETKTAKDWKRPLKKCNCFLKVGACTVSTVYFYLNPSSCQLAWFIQAFSLSSSVQKYGNKATVATRVLTLTKPQKDCETAFLVFVSSRSSQNQERNACATIFSGLVLLHAHLIQGSRSSLACFCLLFVG